jgi:hypothetical protein
LNSDILSGWFALDTSILVEMLLSSDLGKTVEEAFISDSIEGHS